MFSDPTILGKILITGQLLTKYYDRGFFFLSKNGKCVCVRIYIPLCLKAFNFFMFCVSLHSLKWVRKKDKNRERKAKTSETIRSTQDLVLNSKSN